MSTDKKYVELSADNFDEEVIASREPVLVDFWAEWCPPCHALAPTIEDLASEYEGSAKVGKLDIEASPFIADQFSIRSIPTLLFFKDGEEVDRVTGVVPKQVLAKKLEGLGGVEGASRRKGVRNVFSTEVLDNGEDRTREKVPDTFSRTVTAFVVTLSLSALLASGCAVSPEAEQVSKAKASVSTEQAVDRKVRLVTSGDLGLPKPGMIIDTKRTAIVITDPQNDFLSPDGVAWGVVGESVTENHTVDNLESLFKTAKSLDIPVFVSPHYYFPHDHSWKFEGALEALMHGIKMFERKDALSLEGFEGSGADWLARYKPYIEDGKTIVASPHKVYGPDTNDLVLQLRKRGIEKIILGGMSANLCTESHMREFLEQGFEVTVVKDATAAAKVPAGDGYQAALTNFNFMASAVVSTKEAVQALRRAFDGLSVAGN